MDFTHPLVNSLGVMPGINPLMNTIPPASNIAMSAVPLGGNPLMNTPAIGGGIVNPIISLSVLVPGIGEGCGFRKPHP